MVIPQNGKRISKVDMYLNCAEVFAYRSTCIKRKYGAVIVKDDVVFPPAITALPGALTIAVIWEDVHVLKGICTREKAMEFVGPFMQRQMPY